MKKTALRRKSSIRTKRKEGENGIARIVETKKKTKLPKQKVWSDKKADDEFSQWIRKRDGKCSYPQCSVTEIKKLQCSHYHGRRHSATRYDPENCIALCWLHHFKDKLLGFEYQKQTFEQHGYDGQYTIFMRKLLGVERFLALGARARLVKNRREEKVKLMQFLEIKDN